MREKPSQSLENARIRVGPLRSEPQVMHGMFVILCPATGRELKIVSSGTGVAAEGWEHVSVSLETRPPNWSEMCFVKSLFWDAEECVVQYHPPASRYVNCHPYCLHLWKPIDVVLPAPPQWMVGPKVSA